MRIVREKDILQHSDEFSHYGVLGMKWGVHRAKVNEAKSSKYRAKAKTSTGKAKEKNLEKAEKYSNKSKKIQTKHELRAGKDTYKRVNEASVKKLLGQSLLMSTFGALKYNEARSAGKDRLESFIRGEAWRVIDSLTYWGASIVVPRLDASERRKNKNKNMV